METLKTSTVSKDNYMKITIVGDISLPLVFVAFSKPCGLKLCLVNCLKKSEF